MNHTNARERFPSHESRAVLRAAAAVRSAALATCIAGCSDAAPPAGRADGGVPADAKVPVDVHRDVALPPCEPTFESIQKNIFDIACGEGTCHGPPTPAWDLILTDGPAAERRLVGQVAESCPEFFRVVRGQPSASFLWLKVSSPRPPCGEPMPFGGPTLPDWSRACIRDWISGLSAPGDAATE